jgi:hypothetical protein
MRGAQFRSPAMYFTSRLSLRPSTVRASAVLQRATLLAKSNIPAFIPRSDLLDQMQRWLELEVVTDGMSNFGVPCTMETVKREDQLWGFVIHMERVRRNRCRRLCTTWSRDIILHSVLCIILSTGAPRAVAESRWPHHVWVARVARLQRRLHTLVRSGPEL